MLAWAQSTGENSNKKYLLRIDEANEKLWIEARKKAIELNISIKTAIFRALELLLRDGKQK